MNIKIRLALQFTLIVTVILLFFSILVYYFSFSSQLTKFRQSLLEKARNTGILFINVAEVDSTLMKKIHQSTILFDREELVIVDSSRAVLYNNNIQYLTGRAISQNSDKDQISYFSIGEKDGVCYRHPFGNTSFDVFLAAFDNSRKENLSELRIILLWSILFSMLLSVALSYFFSSRAIRPISKIIKSVKDINSLKLANRLDEGKRRDEIDQLAITFNEMLSDLEVAFRNQEDFVSNASHELRTPLTVMISETDYLLSRERTQEEYNYHISGLSEELKKLNSLLNSLLELAQINRDHNILFTGVRIDEIVFNAIHQVKSRYQGRKIIPRIQYPEKNNDLVISGNEGLLTIAFKNLIDNSCKFSADDVVVEFLITEKTICITISDSGIGIPKKDLDNIYKPFSRASNTKFIGGYGIGLSLVSRVMQLHNAKLKLDSAEGKGTTFELVFERVIN
ncbi:MAG: HAMP domain-containing histidine kinase [Bacteroidales bacterium]|jgi:signal transduction histidine kinase|nr:HAMP domain-containing histidine kinase [Bacteroidales bacterium]